MSEEFDIGEFNFDKVKITNMAECRMFISELDVDFSAGSSVFVLKEKADEHSIKKLQAAGLIDITDIGEEDYLEMPETSSGTQNIKSRANVWAPASPETKLPKKAQLPPRAVGINRKGN